MPDRNLLGEDLLEQDYVAEEQQTSIQDSQRELIRALVDNIYDIQSVRIAVGNRLVSGLRGLGFVSTDTDNESSEEEQEKKKNSLLNVFVAEYDKVSEIYAEKFGNKGSIKKALTDSELGNTYIVTELAYNMVSSFVNVLDSETEMGKILAKEVMRHPLWDAFFRDVKGCGPLMAAVCIAYFDPYKARWPSNFWAYAGLDVISDENGSHARTRKDFVMVPYITKDGEEAEKRSLGYNPKVKTKLLGVLGGSFLKAGKDSKYAKIYYDYKNRILARPDCQELRPVVIHRRANRYAVKMFLKDMWIAWRILEGLPVGDDYAVAKLGAVPHHDSRLNKMYLDA